MGAYIEPIIGRYLHLDWQGQEQRVYFEQAGAGIPLLCLHTAGSDGRQFRALLNDPLVTQHFQVIAFDMPWHGKSSPPSGWQDREYRLTSAAYIDQILTLCEAMELDKPVLMGCSIGGRIVLHMAIEHAAKFRALIGLQSAAYVERYYDAAWLHRNDVHGGEVCGALAYGLISPLSPDDERWETVWHYMQGGPGIFTGDLYFYQIDGDIRDRLHEIDTRACPLYLLTGEYDYSCSPHDTEMAAARIDGAKVTIMQGLGHFPMSENAEQFLKYLRPVLDEIRTL